VDIVKNTTSAYEGRPQKVISGEDILRIQKLVRKVPVSDQVIEYAVTIVKATRPKSGSEEDQNEFVQRYVSWGAGPRASQYLILSAKVKAMLAGRASVSVDDVRSVCDPVLRHRIITNYRAEADRVDVHRIIQSILDSIQS